MGDLYIPEGWEPVCQSCYLWVCVDDPGGGFMRDYCPTRLGVKRGLDPQTVTRIMGQVRKNHGVRFYNLLEGLS